MLRTNSTGNAYKFKCTTAKRNEVIVPASKTPKFFLRERYINLRKKISSSTGEIITASTTILSSSYEIRNSRTFETKSCSRNSLKN